MTVTEIEVDVAAVYTDARARFVELVRGLTAEELEAWVPACPAWTVLEVVAHLAGATADLLEGRFPASDTPFENWTQTQVYARRGRTLGELLAEWDALAPQMAARLEAGTLPPGAAIGDVSTHEQDVRGAVGKPGGRDAAGYRFGANRYLTVAGQRITDAGLPALTVRTPAWVRMLGDGEPGAAVEAPAFDLERAAIGRRSMAQMRAFRWEGDAEAYIPLLHTFGPAKFDVIEPGSTVPAALRSET